MKWQEYLNEQLAVNPIISTRVNFDWNVTEKDANALLVSVITNDQKTYFMRDASCYQLIDSIANKWIDIDTIYLDPTGLEDANVISFINHAADRNITVTIVDGTDKMQRGQSDNNP